MAGSVTTELACQTWEDLARSVAWDFGIDLTYEEARYVLWEHTGFPEFWTGIPRVACHNQLVAYFALGREAHG